MVSYTDYFDCEPKDYFNAVREERMRVSVVLDDTPREEKIKLRAKHEKAIEWIVQCAILNLCISRKEFLNKYDKWKKEMEEK